MRLASPKSSHSGKMAPDRICRPPTVRSARLPWADRHGISYLGWTWDAVAPGSWTCGGGPSLIENYEGKPTPFGIGFRNHLRALARR